jgi:hypothetical protein
VLGAAQYLLPLELGQLVSYRGALAHRDSERTLALLHEVKAFQDTLTKFKQLHVDPHEYACLRAIILFRTNGELHTQSLALQVNTPSDLQYWICNSTPGCMQTQCLLHEVGHDKCFSLTVNTI